MTRAEVRKAVEWLHQQADLGDNQLFWAIKTLSELVLADAVADTIAAHGRVNEKALAKMRERLGLG
jgi:hypothetical protein